MNTPKITAFNIGYMYSNLDQWFKLPKEHPHAGQVAEIAMLCYHIAHAGRSMLVDAPAYEFPGENSEYEVPGGGRAALLEQLSGKGIQPDEITDVIITHAHFDHYNGLSIPDGDAYRPAFPNAAHYLGAGDYVPEDFGELQRRTLQLVDDLGLLTLVEAPLDLGAGITILPAPGETRGHQIVHVDSESEQVYITGDLYHHPLEFREPERNVYWAAEEMRASKQKLMRAAADSGAMVYFTHIEGPHVVKVDGESMVWGAE